MSLKITGISSTLKRLNSVSKIYENSDKILNEFCEIGANEIRKAHAGVMGVDHVISKGGTMDINLHSDISVSVENDGNIHSIVASGENFMFFEFGAGVKRNSPREWENVLNIEVPTFVSPIGQYGKKRGSRQSWIYGLEGQKVITGGYQARHGFAIAINKIVANANQVIKEIANE